MGLSFTMYITNDNPLSYARRRGRETIKPPAMINTTTRPKVNRWLIPSSPPVLGSVEGAVVVAVVPVTGVRVVAAVPVAAAVPLVATPVGVVSGVVLFSLVPVAPGVVVVAAVPLVAAVAAVSAVVAVPAVPVVSAVAVPCVSGAALTAPTNDNAISIATTAAPIAVVVIAALFMHNLLVQMMVCTMHTFSVVRSIAPF
jgi:hypothetical protein